MANNVRLAQVTLECERSHPIADALMEKYQGVAYAAVNPILYDFSVKLVPVTDKIVAEKICIDLPPGETCQVRLNRGVTCLNDLLL